MDPRSESFGAWLDQQVLLTLTVVSTPHPDRVLAAFGPTGFDLGSPSLREVHDIAEPTVRLGAVGDWTYAAEHWSTTAADPTFLERLTSDGSLAVTLCLTATINSVHVARAGTYLAGFEPDFPDSTRWGSTPHAFDQQIADSGFLEDGYQPPGQACASFLQLLTGVALTPAMLEARLPCADLSTSGRSGPAEVGPAGGHVPLVPHALLPEPPRMADGDTFPA